MKHFYLKSVLLCLLMMAGANASAHDIAVNNADGVTIYYKWADNKTALEVTYRGTSYYSYSYEYTGNVVIPKSVTYNGTSYSVTSIGQWAFRGCSGLTSIEIPNSVTSIGSGAFYGCSGLTSIEIPNSVTSIGSDAFYGCSGLTSIEIPNSVTSIGINAFRGCTSLTSIVIPNSVTSIGGYAFDRCTGLTSVSIPNSVTTIGEYAFHGCKKLREIHCKWTHSNPPARIMTDEYGSFSDETYEQAILYVPEFASEMYQSQYLKWSKFQDNVEE